MMNPYVSATVLGGDLFPRPVRRGGWIGWCEWEWSPGSWAARTFDGGLPAYNAVRFDPRDQGVALRIATVLRARGFEVGHLLPVALGGRVEDGVMSTEDPENGMGVAPRTVPAADRAAVLLHACVAGVESGRGVVRGLLGEWYAHGPQNGSPTRSWTRGRLFDPRNEGGGVYVGADADDGFGWQNAFEPGIDTIWMQGPETGPEGRACADAALLRLGFAFDDSTAPFGLQVPFNLENER